jgi:hypothetical protein
MRCVCSNGEADPFQLVRAAGLDKRIRHGMDIIVAIEPLRKASV